jgi:serine/threonine protein kinase
MPSQETSRGLEYLRGIVESGKILKLESKPINEGFSYFLRITGLVNEWQFSLSRAQIDDLPGTKKHHTPANTLARSLDDRFKNVNPNYFVTLSGRLLNIDVEWPAFPWITSQGFAAATGQWVRITDLVSTEVARCVIQTTHQQDMFEASPYGRPSQIINTTRSNIDSGALRFYAKENLPHEFPPTRLQIGDYNSIHAPVQNYLAQKVWLLGFVAGSGEKRLRTWIADPWDADYLGCTVADLRRAAAVLDAQEKIILGKDELGENEEFASVGKVMLAANGPIRLKTDTDKPTFRTALSTYIPKKPLGEGGSGKVLLVSDQNGDEFALKYLKPDVQTEQKTKRFKNELAFCTRNTHPNIITIEDNGLAEIDGNHVPFFVMQVFPKTLRVVTERKAPPDKLLLLFADVLNGIEFAHGLKIWHRDLKPENILITDSEDRAVVTDFGIAHFDDEYLHTLVDTLRHERLANFRYAAPEQRSKGNVDQRTDIYALGLILYEMFTGQLLQGTQHQRIGSIKPEYSYLDPIVERMTCQSADDRPSSISLVREMLIANSPSDTSQSLRTRFDHETTPPIPSAKKPPLATARYEIKGTAVKVDTYVRPHHEAIGTFTFETSSGEIFHGTEQQTANRFAETDRRLRSEGFERMGSSNLSGKRLFDI